MVRNVRANIRTLAELPEEEQWELASGPNVHFAERIALFGSRKIHSERGINRAGLESTSIPNTIAARNWIRFTDQPWNYHPGLVREFYAAMVPEVFKAHGIVWVQETQVEITPAAINAYLQTVEVPECVYSDGMPVLLHVDTRALAASLRRDGMNAWGPENALLQHGDLHPDLAFWTVFCNHNLMGSNHRTNVSLETAQLLYAIQHGHPFDVGLIIFNQILSIGYDHRSLLYFPGLITHFCRQANIAEAFDPQNLVAPENELTKKAYNHFCTHHGLPNLPTNRPYRNRGIRGRGAAAQPQQAAGRGAVPPHPAGVYQEAPPQWAEQLIQTVGSIEGDLHRVVQYIDTSQAQEAARRHSGNVYTRRGQNVVFPQGHSSREPGQSSRRHDDSDSD